MIRLVAFASVIVATACSGPPRLSADIDVSEQTVRPTAAFSLGGLGVRVSP